MKQFFHSLPIKTKMFLSFASVSFIFVLVIGIVVYVDNTNKMKTQSESMSEVLSTQFSRTIDLYFRDVNQLSLAIFSNPVMQKTLSEYENQSLYEDALIKNNIYPILFNQTYQSPDVKRITIYTNTGTVFDYDKSRGMKVSYEPTEKDWMKSLNEIGKSSFLLLPTEEVSLLNGSTEEVVSLVRHIYEIPGRRKIGSLKIDIDIEAFEKMLKVENVMGLEEHLRVLVLSEDGSVIFDDRDELIGEQQAKSDLLEVEKRILLGKAAPLHGQSYSDFTTWEIITLIDDEFITAERNQTLTFIVLSGLAITILIAVISYLLSSSITRPIVTLTKKMEKVENGHLAERMEWTGNREIDLLVRVYNSMLDSVNKLIAEVYESSIAEKNAKISALQSQINPHFLYNTLNVMKAISRVKGVEEVAEISESLSHLFKYSMKDLDKKVFLQEEYGHIQNYMRIQQYRFMNRFIFEKNITDKVKTALIPKLLIQPLVENAVVHGLAYMKRGGVVQLFAHKQGDYLIIEVKDNGAGMSEETLNEVKNNLDIRMIETKEGGIGLRNIAQRIQLTYGYEYKIEIESEVDKGTTVRVILPCELGGFQN
ncbi:histidine kinase/DNA gyrase B/HSP90-like ATPase [Planomicrobium soli]|uniref:histidine kinase n=1 Tax=Planomicrobium soli TaxID=1176648 RepID=A0A2P8GQL4_9BACL|nr:sensor histidine kinase [Planomicrobium soli]PSL36263.1 histidine kinase/DNA gyrase B/HSP90-like ATPase [Planomicrobium soli]